MQDMVELSKLSIQQLQEMLQTIERKIALIGNQDVYDLMYKQKETIMLIIQEKQMMDSLKIPPMPAMSLTVDSLSEKEDEERNKQSKS